MELLDYVLFRWKSWAALFVAGIALILGAGLTGGSDGFNADARILVRPSSGEATAYASDPDRYIDTEMTLLYTEGNLARVSESTGMSAAELGNAMTFSREPASETVTLTVNAADKSDAIQAVNAVANSYVNQAASNSGPNDAETQAVNRQIRSTQRELDNVTSTIQQAQNQFSNANPDESVPDSSKLTPRAAVRQSLLTSRLQSLSSQQTDLRLSAATSGTRSQLLSEAEDAASAGGWSPTTLLAAVAGWFMILLTVAAAGLALTSRVIGPARWAQATTGSRFPSAVHLKGRTQDARRRTSRRVITALDAMGTPGRSGAPVNVVYQPERTEVLVDRAAFVLQALEERGMSLRDRDSLAEVIHRSAPGDDEPVARTLLIVDLAEARMQDAAALTEFPARAQRHAVPVLV